VETSEVSVSNFLIYELLQAINVRPYPLPIWMEASNRHNI
jgi:hypothetical protein